MELHTTHEQSQLLASNGYEEDTFFFYAKRIKTGTWHLCIPIQAEDTETKKFCEATAYYSYTANTTFSQYEFEEDTLPAPTLAEIPLPPQCVIKKRFAKLNELEPSGKWFVAHGVYFVSASDAENSFETELKARVMAFVWWAQYLKTIEKIEFETETKGIL